MQVAYSGRHRQHDVDYAYFADPAELAHWAGILVVCVRGGAGTRGLIGKEVIDALGADGYFINVSRGSVVDEPYLVQALADGRLAGAGLDVFADEPNVPEALLEMDNVVLQPHIGAGTNY